MDHHEHAVRPWSRLDDALDLLDPQSRQVVELWLHGQRDSEISVRLDLSERAIASMRARSLPLIRDSIALRAPPDGPAGFA